MRKVLYLFGGLILAFILFVNLVNAPHKRQTDHTNQQNAERIVTALRAYQHDRGRYPDQLDGLQPTYLDSVPWQIGYPGDTTHRSFHYDVAEGGKNFKLGYWEAAMGMLPSDAEEVFDSATGEWKTEMR